ncbi:hypothetical protein LguiB_034678 [Lonicera macranthoides]
MGTRSTSFASSIFSSCLTITYLNSSLSENNRQISMSPIVGFKCLLYVDIVP